MKKTVTLVFLAAILALSAFASEFIPEYKIGDEGPGGGIVFYVSERGFSVPDGQGNSTLCHYLEVSKEDIGGTGTTYSFYPEKSAVGDLPTILKSSLGSGKENTWKIIQNDITHNGAVKPKPLSESNCAAMACYKYTTATTKEGDWFLPSLEELRILQTVVTFYLPELRTTFNNNGTVWAGLYYSSTVKNKILKTGVSGNSYYPTYPLCMVDFWIFNSASGEIYESSKVSMKSYEVNLYSVEGTFTSKRVYSDSRRYVRAVHAF